MLGNFQPKTMGICQVCNEQALIYHRDAVAETNVGTCCAAAWNIATSALNHVVKYPRLFGITTEDKKLVGFRHPQKGEFTAETNH
jgi:hypothetical protein